MTALLKPTAVPNDALVAVVSPASTPRPERVESGLEALRALGYAPQPADHILTRGPLYFAGTPEMRLRDLHHAFADDEVRAIFATRGGYGSNYLLDALDLDLIAESAKPFIGYSDLTAVQLWLLDQIALPAFHGPMLSADFAREDGVHLPSLKLRLAGRLTPWAQRRDCGLCIRAVRAALFTEAASAFWLHCWALLTNRRQKASCCLSKT